MMNIATQASLTYGQKKDIWKDFRSETLHIDVFAVLQIVRSPKIDTYGV